MNQVWPRGWPARACVMDPDQSRLETAEQLMDAQDYEGALALYRELAESGCAPAQLSLGTMLLYGIGDHWDIEAGLAWLHRAGDRGQAWAWLNIGTAYAGGVGALPADLSKAHKYYQRAIAAGCPIVPWLEFPGSETRAPAGSLEVGGVEPDAAVIDLSSGAC